MTNNVDRLRRARRDRLPVKVTRTIEGAEVLTGLVVAVHGDCLCLALLWDGLVFDGFSAVRLHDVRSVKVEERRTDLVHTSLQLDGGRLPSRPPEVRATLERTLEPLAEAQQVLMVHREYRWPDELLVGSITELHDRHLALQNLSPEARWDREDDEVRLADLSRVEWQRPYSETLRRVAEVWADQRQAAQQ